MTFAAIERRTAARLGAAIAVIAALVGACRRRDGEHCVCFDDCAAGLVCSRDGHVLTSEDGNRCFASGSDPTLGECVPADDAGVSDDGNTTVNHDRFDLGGRRDFVYVPPEDTSSTSNASSSTGEASGTDAGSSSSSGSSGSESSSSSSTGGGSSSSSGASSSGASSGSESSGSGSSGDTAGLVDAPVRP